MVLVYPNQKIVKVHKEPADKTHFYCVINKNALMTSLRDLTHNELKTFLYLAANQPGYEMALSTSDIAAQVGANVDGIRTAVNGLIRKGYLVENHGKHYDFYEVSQTGHGKVDSRDIEIEPTQAPESCRVTSGKTSVYPAEDHGEIIKRDYMENTLQYIEPLSEDTFSWDEIFKMIKVNRYPHSMRQLQEAAGMELDANVIRRIVRQNWSSFEKKMDEQEGYRFKTLLNLTRSQYSKWKNIIANENAEYQRTRKEWQSKPRIDYENIYQQEPAQDGLGDISALLDEIFGDFDDVG